MAPSPFLGGSQFVRRVLPLILLVAVLSAVVGLAANQLRLMTPSLVLDAGSERVVRMLGILLALVGFAGLIFMRSRTGRSGARSDPSGVGLWAAAALMGVIGLLAQGASVSEAERSDSANLAPIVVPATGNTGPGERERAPVMAPLELPDFGVRANPTGRPVVEQTGEGRDPAATQRLARWLVLLLGLVALAIYVLLIRGSYRRIAEPEEPSITADQADAGLEESLDELARQGGDPGRRITAAYHRLLSVLAAASAPREPQEAPHEHLHRVLGPLGVQVAPLHRLTEIYVVAQFGERPVTEDDRSAAAGALEESLVQLRAVHRPEVGNSRVTQLAEVAE